MTGAGDPDDRRTFPVLGAGGALPASADASLHAWYQTLASLRADLPVLRDGALQFLVTNNRDRTLAYSRYDGAGLAIVALNPDPDKAARIRVPLADALGRAPRVPDGVRFTDRVGGMRVTSADGALIVDLPPLTGAVLVPDDPVPAPLAAPSGLAAVPQATNAATVSVRWDPVPGADGGYVVYRSPLAGGPATVAGRTSGPTDAVLPADRPPTPGTWWYTVRAVDAKGWVGAPSDARVGRGRRALSRPRASRRARAAGQRCPRARPRRRTRGHRPDAPGPRGDGRRRRAGGRVRGAQPAPRAKRLSDTRGG